jgi:hypothetical protein
MDAIAAQLPPEDAAILRHQIAVSSVLRRENTGAGFYTDFTGLSGLARKVHADTKAADVTAKIGNLENALGFILWMEGGHMNCLEGYTLALDSTVGMDLQTVSFELSSPSN